MSGKTTSQGASLNQGACGVKTGKKHDRGAPYLLIQHNSGCRRHKVKCLVRGFFVKGNLHYQTKPEIIGVLSVYFIEKYFLYCTYVAAIVCLL